MNILRKKRVFKARFFCGKISFFIFLFGFLVLGCSDSYSKTKNKSKKSNPTAKSIEKPIKTKNRTVFDTVLPQKALLASPQFHVVDDFSDQRLKNRRGSFWKLDLQGNEAKAEILKEDARNPRYGFSLDLSFNIENDKPILFKSKLNNLDMSQARKVGFYCSLKASASTRSLSVIFRLTDWKERTQTVEARAICDDREPLWKPAIFDKDQFNDLDWDQLMELSFEIKSKKPIEGHLKIDEISFYGDNEVAFESQADNLKGFPKTLINVKRVKELENIQSDKEFIQKVAEDTWKFFESAADKKTHLIVDHIRLGDGPLAANYTSTSNVAMDLIATVGAESIGLISKEEAIEKIQGILDTLKKLKTWKGLFYNFYETSRLSVTRKFISSVDNGWLAVAFVVLRQAFDGHFADQMTELLNQMNFSVFFEHKKQQISLGYDLDKNQMLNMHYGMLVTEARATSFVAIGKKDLPPSHWRALHKTMPGNWGPKDGVRIDGLVRESNYYTYQGKKFIPSWGGSLFEFLMPTLVLNEKKYARNSFAINNVRVTRLQIQYAKDKEYNLWGFSPSAVGNGRHWKYKEFGVSYLGVKGYADQAVVTPHVSFLALDTLPSEAIRNMRKMLRYDAYGEYGFYDTIDLRTHKVNPQYLSLDQGMSFIAAVNFLNRDYIKNLFHQDPVAKEGIKLWKDEKFFENESI